MAKKITITAKQINCEKVRKFRLRQTTWPLPPGFTRLFVFFHLFGYFFDGSVLYSIMISPRVADPVGDWPEPDPKKHIPIRPARITANFFPPKICKLFCLKIRNIRNYFISLQLTIHIDQILWLTSFTEILNPDPHLWCVQTYYIKEVPYVVRGGILSYLCNTFLLQVFYILYLYYMVTQK